MGFGLGYIIIVIALLAILTPYLIGWSIEFGNGSTASCSSSSVQSVSCLSGTYNTTFGNNGINGGTFGNKVYDPIVQQTANGIGISNNESVNSGIFGFLGAFILPGFGNIFTAVFQMPQILGQWLSVLVGIGPLKSNFNGPLIVSYIIDVALLAVCSWGLSMFMKYPSWSQ